MDRMSFKYIITIYLHKVFSIIAKFGLLLLIPGLVCGITLTLLKSGGTLDFSWFIVTMGYWLPLAIFLVGFLPSALCVWIEDKIMEKEGGDDWFN